jgi:hypothetical protein
LVVGGAQIIKRNEEEEEEEEEDWPTHTRPAARCGPLYLSLSIDRG